MQLGEYLKENGENSYSGMFARYDGGGYVTILPADGDEGTKNKTLATIQQMRKDRWFDRQTRAIFVTVNLFNPSTGYLTPLRLILEHPAAGGMYMFFGSLWHFAWPCGVSSALWVALGLHCGTLGFHFYANGV